MDGMEAKKNDEAKIEFQKLVIRRKDEKHEENLETQQKDIEEAAGKVAHSTKNDRDKALNRTRENVRIREEQGAQE